VPLSGDKLSVVRFGKWETIRELGRGGQGVAYLALDTTELDLPALLENLRRALDRLRSITTPEDNQRNALAVLGIVEKYLQSESGKYSAVLKVLHEPARRDAKALERLRNEIVVLGSLNHPNLIRIIDSSPQEGWFAAILS